MNLLQLFISVEHKLYPLILLLRPVVNVLVDLYKSAHSLDNRFLHILKHLVYVLLLCLFAVLLRDMVFKRFVQRIGDRADILVLVNYLLLQKLYTLLLGISQK